MQPAYGAKPTEQYLAQQIAGTSPEQLAVLLLEGAQRFLAQAITAINRRDIAAKARLVNRVSAIVEELTVQLNYEAGGELVANLARLYEWWLHELFDASQQGQVDRLERIGQQMADLRATWEELVRRQVATPQAEHPARLTDEGLMG